MKKYMLLIFLMVTFTSQAAIVMAQDHSLVSRNEVIAGVVAFVCLSITATFLISLKKSDK